MTIELPASDLAARIGAELRGDDCQLRRVAALENADADCLCYLSGPKHRRRLRETRAGAVILAAEAVGDAPCTCLVTDNPTLAFARAVALLHPRPRLAAGRHPSAVIAADAHIDDSAAVGPLCVIESKVEIGPDVEIGPGCVVQEGSVIGAGSRLVARVTICRGSIIGARALLHPGAVVGREGFGFAQDGDRWVRIPQIGHVRIGDDVEVGANTAIDRGALEATVIGDGVKLDNLIQIGHNVHIGANTAMAACSGISGSTQIGQRCTVAGAAGMAGHLTIGDDVHFTGMAMVTRSFTEPGLYSSGIPAMTNADWRRNVARFRHLDELSKRVKSIEQRLDGEPDPRASGEP